LNCVIFIISKRGFSAKIAKVAIKNIRIIVYSTGSKPLFLENGLHLQMRDIPSKKPFIKPFFLIASIIYSEQVGAKRQLCPRKGDINIL
jgi:hypothetical protein